MEHTTHLTAPAPHATPAPHPASNAPVVPQRTAWFTRLVVVAAMLLLLPVVGHVTDAAGPALGVAAADDEVGIWLVTIPENDAGWAILDGQSQWVDLDCRWEIEANGGAFDIVPWAVLESTIDRPDPLSCAEIQVEYFGVTPWWSTWNPPSPVGPAVMAADAHGATTAPDPASAVTADPAVVPAPPPPALTPATPAPLGPSGVRLARGINLAGDFEVTPRGSWGTPIQDWFFPLVAERGFDHVRIPIRWSAWTGPAPDHRIDPGFFAEVDRLVDLAGANGLGIVLDVHFFEALDDDPWGERDRFLAIWDQIARRYQNRPASVVFELLNEPVGVFTEQSWVWNDLAADAVDVIRRTNPDRTVIIGPVNWNHASRLGDLVLPSDPNIVTTIHTYDPFTFTHQGAVWTDPIPPTGQVWRADERTVAFDFSDRSWNISTTPSPQGIQVDFAIDWAAFAVADESPGRHDQVRISADRRFDGLVLCNVASGQPLNIEIDWSAGPGGGVADVSGCGVITDIAVQVANGGTRVVFDRVALCAAVCDEIILTNAEALDGLITTAAQWAAERGSTLYIGEFGVLSLADDPTDTQSRYEWTRTVRTAAERNGAGWAYFELSSDFGAWNAQTGTWTPEVVNALFD